MFWELELHLASELPIPSEAGCFLTTNARKAPALSLGPWVTECRSDGVVPTVTAPGRPLLIGHFGLRV